MFFLWYFCDVYGTLASCLNYFDKTELRMIANQTGDVVLKLPSSTVSIANKRDLKRKNTTSQNADPYLSLETIQKILNKFLVEKNIQRETLAKLVEITIDELNLILIGQASLELIIKVNLPLIKLYCESGFIHGKCI